MPVCSGMRRKLQHRGRLYFLLILLAGLVAYYAFSLYASINNGFDLSNTSVNPDEILSGGPERDGIPAIDNPVFVPVDKVGFLQDDDLVVGSENTKLGTDTAQAFGRQRSGKGYE